MYLKGLGDCAPSYFYPVFNDTAGNAGRTCTSAGGSWVPGGTGGTCYMPSQCSAPAAAPTATSTVTVTVPTNVNTNISPQISPNLIQQQQPVNSGVKTGSNMDTTGGSIVPSPATQMSPYTQPDTSMSDAIAAMLASQQEQNAMMMAQQRARDDAAAAALAASQKAQQDQMDAYLKAQAGQQQSSPAMQTTTQYVPSPGDAGLPPDLSNSFSTQTDVKSKTSYLPFILAGVALLALSGGKGKNRVHK